MDSLEAELATAKAQIRILESNNTELWKQLNEHKADTHLQFVHITETLSKEYREHIERAVRRAKEECSLNSNHKFELLELRMNSETKELAKTYADELSKRFDGKLESKTGWISGLPNIYSKWRLSPG